MKIRNILLLTGLSVFMAACAGPAGSYFSEGDYPYDDDYYYDYRDTPSYEGYYYARIIFIGDIPYYVDDNRFIRPIPPPLYDHFRRYPYKTLGHPPMFSGDHEKRDGYPMSRIIYLNGVPYHVGNNRIAQPLPERLRPHFRYTPPNPVNAPANGNRPQPPFIQHDNGGNNVPPGFGQDRGGDRNRDEHGLNGQNREFMGQPPIERGPREGGGDASVDHEGRPAPSTERRNPMLQQGQPNAGESHADTTNGRSPDHNRPQAVDSTGKKNTEMNTDKNSSSSAKKDKQDNSTQADDGSDKNDNGKKPRDRGDNDQGGNDRSNGRRRD